MLSPQHPSEAGEIGRLAAIPHALLRHSLLGFADGLTQIIRRTDAARKIGT